MDTDFHFYGTATAAVHAGFSGQEATLIANAAEFVDFFNSDYWSYWSLKNEQQQEVVKISYPHLSCQTIDWKMIGDYDEDLWNAFHFPPGNRAHDESEVLSQYWGKEPLPVWITDFKQYFKSRETNLTPSKKPLLCRPFSPFALHMMLDTIAKYREITTAKSSEIDPILKRYLGNVPYAPVKDPKKLALVLLGVRMHVLADTWAHQDFSGIASKEINGAGTLNYVYASTGSPDILENTSWKGTLWVIAEDTDCAAAPNAPGNAACRGHGQMGHFPDYSWLKFIYPAAWLKQGGYLFRDNPQQYRQAWYWLRTLMASCLGGGYELLENKHNQPCALPDDILNCIDTPHALDDTKLFAIAESEQLWRKTELAKQLKEHQRWNRNAGHFDELHRKELGVIDGLPTTRYGTVNISQNSTLHLMEMASAIHYQWCVQWAEEHPEFQWIPQPKV